MELEGTLRSGLGEGAMFTQLDWVAREFREKLGFVPHPGTLNLALCGETWAVARARLSDAAGITIEPPPGYCAAKCFEVLINDCVKGAAVLPDIRDYPTDKLEIVAPVALRQKLRLRDGDLVNLRLDFQ